MNMLLLFEPLYLTQNCILDLACSPAWCYYIMFPFYLLGASRLCLISGIDRLMEHMLASKQRKFFVLTWRMLVIQHGYVHMSYLILFYLKSKQEELLWMIIWSFQRILGHLKWHLALSLYNKIMVFYSFCTQKYHQPT